MTESAERLDRIESRLAAVEGGQERLRGEVGGLREEVGDLRGDVGGLREEVGELRGEVRGLQGRVHKLQVLSEQNASDIQRVAVVQAQHGAKLDELGKAIEPLGEMHAFVRLVASNHEVRLQTLEEHTGVAKRQS